MDEEEELSSPPVTSTSWFSAALNDGTVIEVVTEDEELGRLATGDAEVEEDTSEEAYEESRQLEADTGHFKW